MKSIKNQYFDLQEGKMTQYNFMRNLRMSLPQYVTNVTSFKDAVKILKNKGILNEAKRSEEEGYYLQNGEEQYSNFNEIDNINSKEVMSGIQIEHECYPNKTKTEIVKLVIKNIKKDPYYYTNYKLSGKSGYTPGITGGVNPKDRQMQFLEKNKSNLVDKKMGMKDVPNVGKIKASSNKSSDETIKPVKNVSSMSLVAKSHRGVQKMADTGEKMKKIKVKEGIDSYEKWKETQPKSASIRGGIAKIGSMVSRINPATGENEIGIIKSFFQLSGNTPVDITVSLEDGTLLHAPAREFILTNQ